MKTKSKVLLITLSALLLTAVTLVGTLAWLTSSAEVVNTFTVGKVSIALDEADVDEYGEPVPGADRVMGNEYRLIPGNEYVKDPTVTVKAGSEAAYVRMLVTINKYSTLKAIFGDNFLPQNYVEGWDSETWVPSGTYVDQNADTVTYEFRYYDKAQDKHTVNAVDSTADVVLPALFESFTLPGTVTGEQLEQLYAGEQFKITVFAHAIQELGFENDPDGAWNAFDEQVAVTTNSPATSA